MWGGGGYTQVGVTQSSRRPSGVKHTAFAGPWGSENSLSFSYFAAGPGFRGVGVDLAFDRATDAAVSAEVAAVAEALIHTTIDLS